MSGGHFDYQQYKIKEMADSIETYIDGQELDDSDIESYYNEYKRGWIDKEDWEYIKTHKRTIPNEYELSDKTIASFRAGVQLLRTAYIYAQRIDWLLSGDDGEETFNERLKEDLNKLLHGNN